jgi:hypothetical protein
VLRTKDAVRAVLPDLGIMPEGWRIAPGEEVTAFCTEPGEKKDPDHKACRTSPRFMGSRTFVFPGGGVVTAYASSQPDLPSARKSMGKQRRGAQRPEKRFGSSTSLAVPRLGDESYGVRYLMPGSKTPSLFAVFREGTVIGRVVLLPAADDGPSRAEHALLLKVARELADRIKGALDDASSGVGV